jgi:FMN phosphatase YigB (HAD superfamily)
VSEVGVSKPNPEIFHYAVAALYCEPESTWFVGDDPVVDVRGAAAALLLLDEKGNSVTMRHYPIAF